jgi:hypothetical protein
MELTGLERDFLRRLLGESWVSPPMFDHEIVARLVELGLVETEPLPSGDIEYRITDAGGRRLPRKHRSGYPAARPGRTKVTGGAQSCR